MLCDKLHISYSPISYPPLRGGITAISSPSLITIYSACDDSIYLSFRDRMKLPVISFSLKEL